MIDISRRRRIAAGSGVDPSDVSSLVKQFDAMAALVKQMSQMSMLDKIRAMTGLGRAGAFNPGARLVAPKQGTGKRLSPKEREKLRKQREKEERKKRREQRGQAYRGDHPSGDPEGDAVAQIQLSRETCVRVASRSLKSRGSGFLISPRHAITCFHVVGRISMVEGRRHWTIAGDIEVMLDDGQAMAATCISLPTGEDKAPLDHDFAVLELAEAPNWSRPSLPLAAEDFRPKVGARVTFSGYPFASPGMATHLGSISGWDQAREVMSVQAAMNKGHSGGALVAEDGTAVGIISLRHWGIGRGLGELSNRVEQMAMLGIIAPMEVDPWQSVRDLIKTLDTFISTGIGYANDVRHLREYLARHPLPEV